MTQTEQIQRRLKRGWLTPMQAFEMGITRLAARVFDMREEGHPIEDQWRKQNGKRFKAYRMAR